MVVGVHIVLIRSYAKLTVAKHAMRSHSHHIQKQNIGAKKITIRQGNFS